MFAFSPRKVRGVLLWLALVCCATVTVQAQSMTHSFRLTVTSLGDPVSGEIEPESISIGDSFTFTFEIDPFATITTIDETHVQFLDAFLSLSVLPGEDNVGTFFPELAGGTPFGTVSASAAFEGGPTRLLIALNLVGDATYSASGGLHPTPLGTAELGGFTFVLDSTAPFLPGSELFELFPASDAGLSFPGPQRLYFSVGLDAAAEVYGDMAVVPEANTLSMIVAGLGLLIPIWRLRSRK